MTKIRGKILSLFLAVTLLLGLTPMMTYAAETTNPGANARETEVQQIGDISVTKYPSAVKFKNTSNKNLYVKIETAEGGKNANGRSDEWIGMSANGGEKIVAPLAGGVYKVTYCYMDSNYEPDTSTSVSENVTVIGAGYDEEAFNAAGEYVIDYKNGTHIYVVSANDNESKAFYTYMSGENPYVEYATTWYAFPDATTTKIVVTNTGSIEPYYFQSKESGTSGDLTANKFSMGVTFRNVSIENVDLGFGTDKVTIEGNVSTKTASHRGNLEIVGNKATNPTFTITNSINASTNLTIKDMNAVCVPENGNISATQGKLQLISIGSLVKNGSGGVSGGNGVVFENVKNFYISSNYNTVYSTNGDVTFKNSVGKIITTFGTGKAVSPKNMIVYETGFDALTGADAGSAREITDYTQSGNEKRIYTSSVTIGKYFEIDGEFVEEAVAVPPTIDVETPGVIKITQNPLSEVQYRAKIVDSNNVVIADWRDLLFDEGVTEISPLDGGEYTISYGYENSNYELVESSIETVSVTVKAIGYEESYEVGDEELIIDYANVTETTIVGDDDDDIGHAILVYPSMNDAIDFIESIDPSDDTIDYTVDAFAPKYYTYDGGKTWFRLPDADDVEIVVENSSTTVAPTFFGIVQVPVSNFDVTFRNLSVDGVMLGFGDAELTVEGNVVVGQIAQFGNLEIVGKDETATFKSYDIAAINEEIAETYGNITFKDMNKVTIGDRGDSDNEPTYGSIMALNSINLSNIENFVVIAEDNALNAFYDINISNVNNIEITSLYGIGMYSFQGDVSINGGESLNIDAGVGIVALNVDIDGGNTLSIDIKAIENGIYAGQKFAYSSESENQEEYVIGELSIQNCKAVNISGKEVEWQSEGTDSYLEPVYIAIEGTDITINNVTALTIKDAENGIVANNGNLSIDGGNTLYIEADWNGIHAMNVDIKNIKDSIDIWAVSRGIMAAPVYSYINESEIPEDAIGVISIQDCGAVNISGNDYIMPSDEDATDVFKIVELAMAGTDIRIVNVDSLTIKDAAVGILSEDGNVLLEDIADMNISAMDIGILCSVVKLKDVLGTVVISEDSDYPAVMATDKVVVIHTKNISVVSRDAEGNEVVLERNADDNTVTVDETHKYFAIVKAFTFDSFVEQVENEDLPGFQVNNETKESDIVDFIEGLVEETGEEGLTFEILSFDMEPVKDSTNGSIELEVKFTYVEDGETLTKTINTVIDISLRVYVAEKYEEFEDAMANILGAEITSDNKALFSEALELANLLLKDANKAELTETELAKVNADYAFLNESLAQYEKILIEEELAELVEKEAAIPELETITRKDKSAVEELFKNINEFEDLYAENLTDEQKDVVAELKESVEARMDKIDAQIVDVIENVVRDTLASITKATNDSDVKTKVEESVAAAIAADPTLKGVTVTYDITKVNATTDAEGSIKGKVVITSGDVAKEVAVSFVIGKLPVHQHDFIWVITKDATDATKGEMKGTCSCGEAQTKEIPATAGDDASGKVTVESDEDNDFKAQLTDDEDVKGKIELTQDEQDAIIAGEDLEIILKLEDTTVEVDTAEKEDIAEKLAEKDFEGKKLGTFLDINLIKKIGNTETKIEETNGLIKLTFEVPAGLINKDATINRTYTIVRNHEGKIEFLKAEFDKETNQLTFETDKFSTYAVIYEDTAVVPEAPKTGDATNFMPILALLFAGLGMVVVGKKKRA